jgi:hypothetical protein
VLFRARSPCNQQLCSKRSVPWAGRFGWLGEERGGVAAGVGGERVDEVGVQAAALQAAGGVRGEQPFDASFAAGGLGAEGELAVDDR